MPPPLTVTLDRGAGTAVMAKGGWSQAIQIGDLRSWLRFYRRLWSRKAKGLADEKTPGPWAGFYADDAQALERALLEAENG